MRNILNYFSDVGKHVLAAKNNLTFLTSVFGQLCQNTKCDKTWTKSLSSKRRSGLKSAAPNSELKPDWRALRTRFLTRLAHIIGGLSTCSNRPVCQTAPKNWQTQRQCRFHGQRPSCANYRTNFISE